MNDENIPFLGLDAEDPIGQYYRDINNVVMEIHESNGSKESIDSLVALARERYIFELTTLYLITVFFFHSVNDTQEYDLSKCCKGMLIKKEELFRMLIWLSTYYGFKKVIYSRNVVDTFYVAAFDSIPLLLKCLSLVL